MAFDLDVFLASPRASGLALSPAGDRLVTSVATLAPDGTSFVSALWELDPAGGRAPRRLTRSAAGERAATFLPDGGLLFTSSRPDPGAEDGDDDAPALWLLPAGGGEASQVAATPGGVGAFTVARDAGTVVLATEVFPAASSLDEDRERGKSRKDAKVGAVLFESYPIRFWDHDLGPRRTRLFAAPPPTADDDRPQLRDLTPDAGGALHETTFSVTPDGGTVVTTWHVGGVMDRTADLVAIDVADGRRRTLAHVERTWHDSPACSPDGRWVAVLRSEYGSPDAATQTALWLVDLADGSARRLAADLDLWPRDPVWAPDSSAVYFCADEQGRSPLFRVDLDGGGVRRLSAAGAFHDVHPSPDGRHVYAMRALIDQPLHAVRLDAAGTDQEPAVLPTPGYPLTLTSRVVEVAGPAADGTPLRSWLVLPSEATPENPAPLVVFIHGGPLSSWNEWSWRWCPHLLADRGYAVLLPDPALSTGYGQEFVQRGWGRWGEAPFTDLMAAVDATVARPDVDGSRTAAMGGSFGGYMANWVAGHTDRFDCIVTHASLWALDQFHATTDDVAWLEYEFGDPWADAVRWQENSPHRHLDRISTPMLVIHGENDDRVPVGEALRLYTDLCRKGVESKFLLFPDENHWVLKPNNSRVWYETVFAWLDHHVLGKEFTRPELL